MASTPQVQRGGWPTRQQTPTVIETVRNPYKEVRTVAENKLFVGNVEVLALSNDSDDDIAAFLGRKRQWLFNAVREVERRIQRIEKYNRLVA